MISLKTQEESAADVGGRLASVVHTLSPRAVQVDRTFVLDENVKGGLLTVSLDTGNTRSASRAVSPHFVSSGAVTLSQEKTE